MRRNFKPYKTKQGSHSSNYGDYDKGHLTESNGDRYPIDIIGFNRDKNKIHPTQKPVELCEYLIKTYTNDGDVVLDNCMGSGTTGIACQNTDRKFIGVELDKKYFEIAKQRLKENEDRIKK